MPFEPARAAIIVTAGIGGVPLATALQCAMAQREDAVEILVVADPADTAAAEVVATFRMIDARFRPVAAVRPGLAARRNQGLAESRAPVVAFLEPGDLWTPDLVRIHLGRFDADARLGVSYGRVRVMRPEGMDTPTVTMPPPAALTPMDALGCDHLLTGSNLVVRRAAVASAGGFDETADTGAADGSLRAFLFRMLLDGGWRVAGVDAVLVRHRLPPEPPAAGLARHEAAWRAALDAARRHAPDLVRSGLPAARSAMLGQLARWAAERNVGTAATLGLLARSVAADPLGAARRRAVLHTLRALLDHGSD